MVKTSEGLRNLYRIYIYYTDGICDIYEAYDYAFEGDWFKFDSVREAMYIKESVIETLRVENIMEVGDD